MVRAPDRKALARNRQQFGLGDGPRESFRRRPSRPTSRPRCTPTVRRMEHSSASIAQNAVHKIGGAPMSATMTSPVYARAVSDAKPTLPATNVTVKSARMAALHGRPVSQSNPDGTSTATTAALAARLMPSIKLASGSRTSPRTRCPAGRPRLRRGCGYPRSRRSGPPHAPVRHGPENAVMNAGIRRESVGVSSMNTSTLSPRFSR